ncbi:MAG: redox-sensing transcriptional repressor Rex [Corynebacteriales bacterium]|nr:redox-sensing transcriptional repressor Rex [Mycobacteriales bacterium]
MSTLEPVTSIPQATVARLPLYLRALHQVAEAGNPTVSSAGLAAAAGVNPAKVRKDLSYLGSYGMRGIGYDVATLTQQISASLGLERGWGVALVGVGRLGQALTNYAGFANRGFAIKAVFDSATDQVGTKVGPLTVQHVNELPQVVAAQKIAIGIIATPAEAAQDVCDQLIAAGVTSILNFAPCVLFVPKGVDLRKVDLAIELQILSYHEHHKTLPDRGTRLAPRRRRGSSVPSRRTRAISGALPTRTTRTKAVDE